MSERAVIRTDPPVKDALRIETHGSDHIPETETEQRERETIVFRRGAEGRWLAVLEHLSPAP
jgi:ketosteroid isomerase-like protein